MLGPGETLRNRRGGPNIVKDGTPAERQRGAPHVKAPTGSE